MNVYDFDKTIYHGDSTAHFFLYCLWRYPAVWLTLPATALAFISWQLGLKNKTQFKETMYRFLQKIPNIDRSLEKFWEGHEKNIKDWYFLNHLDSDVVISASPEFLLEGICRKLKVGKLIASRVDKHTGLYIGENCHGQEKVRRFYEEFPEGTIEEFYSDSKSDTPLARLSLFPFLVKCKKIREWK